MGLRFFRRVRLAPGVTLNLSRSGVSTSIGTRGAHVTLGHGKTRETVGIPGAGLSYTTTQKAAPRRRASPVLVCLLLVVIVGAVVVKMVGGA
jgi:hypothetical protein